MAKKTTLGSSAQYTRSYTDLRGVDVSSDPSQVGTARASYLVNMYRDYDSEHGAAIETIPGYRRLFDFGGKIHGIWGYSSSQEDEAVRYVVVHSGTRLIVFPLDGRDGGEYTVCFEGLADEDSSAFLQNNNFYICDGNGIFVMKADLSVCSLEADAYVPITYLHGAPYEQRNMLCDGFINRDTAVAEDRVTDFDGDWDIDILKTSLSAFAYEETVDEDGDHIYTITGFANRVFDEIDMTNVLVNVGVFEEEEVDGEIKDTIVYHRIELSADHFLNADSIKRIFWGGREFDAQGWTSLEEVYTYENNPFRSAYHATVTIYDPCLSITKVTVGGREVFAKGDERADEELYYMPVSERVTSDEGEEWYISFLHIFAKNRSILDTQEIDIEGIAEAVRMETAQAVGHTDYLNANKEYGGTSQEAIVKCRIAATFDGRVFLTGNPRLPNTVFYSCRDLTGYNNPAYFGVYNYFNDGEGNEPNVALLSTSSVLMVLKRNTVGGSAIYYHTGADGLDDVVPRIYPSVPGVAGVGCEGAAINFLDDAVFLSDRGLEGVSKEQLNLERTVGHRSSCVDRFLRQCDLSRARLCRWGGYLCIFDGTGKVFLGDSRRRFSGVDGAAEYEWYYLEGIGAFRGDRLNWRTLTRFPYVEIEGEEFSLEGATYLGDTVFVDDEVHEVEANSVYYEHIEVGEKQFRARFVMREGRIVLCDADDEYIGGDFSPACVGYSFHDVFLFGTEDGQICCFNTDKRGIAVDDEAVESDTIHRSWYSFAGHRYLSGIALVSDNCGVPHLTKRSVRKTCVIKLKTMRGSSVSVKIRTDREPWHEVATSFASTDFSFSDLEFDNFSFASESDTIVTVKDKEKKWVEKQFYLYSDGWRRPFGLHSLTYNYEIQGRVKKN